MAKQAAGEKKSKESIVKAANQKKGGTKKWTKGKAKEKAENAVFVDKATYDRIITGIPKLGKHISTSIVIEKFKVVGSIARTLLKHCLQNGSLRVTEYHSRQGLYTPSQQTIEKATTVVESKEATKKEKAPKKKQ